MKYCDEENELVTMSTEEEFQEALKTVHEPHTVLRLHINHNESNTVMVI